MTDWKTEFRKRFVTKIGGMKVVAARCETSIYPSYWDSKDLEVWIDQLLSDSKESDLKHIKFMMYKLSRRKQTDSYFQALKDLEFILNEMSSQIRKEP